MKKLFFTMMLATVSSGLLMANETICVPESPSALYQVFLSVSGTIQDLTYPCVEGEDCPDCLAWAIVTEDKTYYLSTRNNSVRNFLEQIYGKAIPAIYLLPLKATASGIPYQNGEYNFIDVNSINGLSVEYFGSPTYPIPSLCDEWNVLYEYALVPYYYDTHTFRLSNDTLINNSGYRRTYAKLFKKYHFESYHGALREGDNKDIYYIPAGSDHEYLLYAFNAQVGDTLTNLWYGGQWKECPDGFKGVVKEISNSNPRVFTVEIELDFGNEMVPWDIYWTEGVGMPDGPAGSDCPFPCVGSDGGTVLCAYKNGYQIYTSEEGEKFGCYYKSIPRLHGTWQVYKEEISGRDYNEQGEMAEFTRTLDGIDNLYWVIEDSVMYQTCPTCYPVPMHYTFEFGGDYFEITIPGRFDTLNLSTPALKENASPLEGRFNSDTEIEWTYSLYGGDEGPTMYHQYLRKVNSFPAPSDTVHLYIKDGPGSSTVEPVDPNEIVATLKNGVLCITEYIGKEISYKISKLSSPNNMLAAKRALKDDTFTQSVSIPLTENGTYLLELTHPDWNYTITGTFEYNGTQSVEEQKPLISTAKKLLRNGQLVILVGDRTFTLTGTPLQ